MILRKLYLCAEHVYVGHFGGPAGTAPMRAVARAHLLAGRGIEGDRYFQRPEGHKGQVTFFSEEVCQRLADELGETTKGPEVFRRNLLVRDADLISLVGTQFEIQGIRFFGSEYCKPCVWMDEAFAPGTLERLAAWRAGGLRAQVLTDGWLSVPGGRAA